MEVISRHQDHQENPSPANSPASHSSSSNSNNNININNTNTQTQTPPLTPRPISRSEPNPYPTTFVQADTTSFKQVVQMLTGSSKPNPPQDPGSSKISIPPVKTGQQKKQGFKLYERRNSIKNGLMINPSGSKFHHGHGFSPRVQEMLSPSILDFPALVLSPVTPLIEDRFNNNNSNNNKSLPGNRSSSEEERVIAEKGFYLHPSPRAATPRGTPEPQLLPLFPLTSPRGTNDGSMLNN